jgi:general secretion pathway protein G
LLSISSPQLAAQRVFTDLEESVIPECFYRESRRNQDWTPDEDIRGCDPYHECFLIALRLAASRFTSVRNNSTGFTLIELIVVVIIIGLLAGLVLPQFIRQEEKAKLKATQAQIELFGTALDTFRLDVGRYPSTDEGLQALRQKPGALERWDGPYLKKELPADPWGKPYVYRSPGEHGPYDLISYGADGVPGGDGDNRDITSW